jgi:hypothetical protein
MLFLIRILCLTTYVSNAFDISDVFDDEQQKIIVQVEHMEEKSNEVAKNNNHNIDVPHSPPVLWKTNNFIAANRPRHKKDPRHSLCSEAC